MLDSINKVTAMRNTLWIHDAKNLDKCSHQTYSVDLQQDNDHSHDQVHCGSMIQVYTSVTYTLLQSQPGRRGDMSMVS